MKSNVHLRKQNSFQFKIITKQLLLKNETFNFCKFYRNAKNHICYIFLGFNQILFEIRHKCYLAYIWNTNQPWIRIKLDKLIDELWKQCKRNQSTNDLYSNIFSISNLKTFRINSYFHFRILELENAHTNWG